MKKRSRLGVLSALVVLLLVCSAFFSSSSGFSKSLNFETENNAVTSIDGMDGVLKLQNVYRAIAKSLMPAVVSINVESEQTVQNPYGDFFNDPFFRHFFGDEGGNGNMPKEYKRKLQAMGSGFIVTKDGYLFSNYHVVKDATKIVVILADNRKFDAKVIGTDPETDIALLKINANDLPVAAMGDSGEVQVGDFVIAIGNPFGLAGTYTSGIVSFVGRPGMMSGFQRFIQTDAPVNPGNSGGPLVNIKGQVVGINAAIQSQTGGYQGISFAVPVNIAKNIGKQIADQGKIERGYIGINITALDQTTRKMLGLSDNEGVIVSKIEKGSPAEKAGIKKGDIITKVNDDSLATPDDLQVSIGSLKPGSAAKIEVLRNKKRIIIEVKLAVRPSEKVASQSPGGEDNNASKETFEFNGVIFGNASKEVLEQNGAESGIIVNDVKESSPFAGVLDKGYVITSINDTDMKDLGDLKKFAEKNKDTKSFMFVIIKDGFLYYKGIEK